MNDFLSHANQSSSSSTVFSIEPPNMIHLLRRRVQEHGEKTVYTYLQDGESQECRLTYCELERRALAIAADLQAYFSSGERVLLIFPPGTEFPTAFYGCLLRGHGRRADLSPTFQPVSGEPQSHCIRRRTNGRANHDFYSGKVQASNRSDSRAEDAQMDTDRHHCG